ncbi:hypothetical protein HHX47_DHR8000196 [Lentinula edodes]|nr:hypothetical protein HHX47_DHR8000196 [Lentinula edodes]
MIMDSWEYWGWFDFAMLPSLTHLSLNLRIHSLPLESIKHALEFIRDVLGRCTRLRLCIVRISSLGPLEVSEESVQSIHPLIRDQRLVFLYDTEHLFRSQGVEMTRDTSIWEQAGDIYNERDKANTKFGGVTEAFYLALRGLQKVRGDPVQRKAVKTFAA